jgi:ABC-2 type transport system permease protein
MTDAPLTAVGGAVVLVVVSEILDQVAALGSIRQGLPTHYWLAWLDLLVDPVDASNMTKGLLEMVPWVVVPLLLAFWNFRRKDVLS